MPIVMPRPGLLLAAALMLPTAIGLIGCGERGAGTNGNGAGGEARDGATGTSAEEQAIPVLTDDGLTLTDLVSGDGERVPAGGSVTIEFKAWIVGQEAPFDSTQRRRRPISFSLESEGLIKGLRLGIVGMRAGGTRRIEIPATLGYGATGRHPIPPDADLVYEVTLIEWEPGA